MVAIPNHQKWNVTLVWGTAGCDDTDMCDCQFPSFLIDYITVHVNCDGMETITQQVQMINIINVFILKLASYVPRSPSKLVTGRQMRMGVGVADRCINQSKRQSCLANEASTIKQTLQDPNPKPTPAWDRFQYRTWGYWKQYTCQMRTGDETRLHQPLPPSHHNHHTCLPGPTWHHYT